MKNVAKQFEKDLSNVYSLMDFDKFIMEFPLSQLSVLKSHCEQHTLTRALKITDKIITFLSGIRDHDSTKLSYRTIYNQCLVLLVSYFTAALEDIFEYCISSSIKMDNPIWLKEKVHLEISELVIIKGDPADKIGDLIIRSQNISFQDMKSTRKAFNDYFNVEMTKDKEMDNVIFSQASRHIIVHDGGKINSKFLHQIENTKLRTIKKDLSIEDQIIYSKDEIMIIGKSMLNLIEALMSQLSRYQK